MKIMQINNKMYDVVDRDTYATNMDAYIPKHTAIEEDGLALPVVNKSEYLLGMPGIYVDTMFYAVNTPEDLDQYKIDESKYKNGDIIDFDDTKSVGELLKKQEAVRNLEREVLTDIDNVYNPVIHNHDAPAMRVLKEAIIKKHIDLDKYEPRFGANYNNDKRLLNKDKISLQMLERMCNALDIKATLTLEDASGDIPNPIGEVLSTELTEGGSLDE